MPKILVADDSDSTRKIAKIVLTKGGYEVIEACDGLDAVKLAAEELPQLILLDAEMPEMDGWAASKEIKSDPKTSAIPILMCTGHELSELTEEFNSSGADGYITKPYQPALLLQKIKEAIEKSGK